MAPRFALIRGDLEGGRLASNSIEPVLEILAAPSVAPFWLDVEGIAPAEMEALRRAVGLHESTAADCLYEDTKVSDEKWQRFPEYLFVIADILADDPLAPGQWRTENVNVVVLADGAITLRNFPLPALAALAARAPEMLREDPDRGRPDRVLHAVYGVILARLVPLVAAAADAADALDVAVLAGGGSDLRFEARVREIGAARARLAKLRGSLSSKREILTALCSADLPVAGVAPAVRVRLRGALDQAVWRLARVEAARETLRGASANLFAIVNLRVGAAANETNRAIKNLSLLLAFTTPLTLVASVMGMNVYPLNEVRVARPEDRGDWSLMASLLAAMAGATLGLLALAKRQGLLQRPAAPPYYTSAVKHADA